MSLELTVPSTCAACKDSIAQSKAVFLHCDCCIAYCLKCVLGKISNTNEAYHEFVIQCPNCKGGPVCNFQRTIPQINEESKKAVERATEDALKSAFNWIGLKNYSNLPNKEKVRCKNLLQNRGNETLERCGLHLIQLIELQTLISDLI